MVLGFQKKAPPDRRLDDLIAGWIEYRDRVAAQVARGSATPDEEREFLELKGRIAASLPCLSGAFPPGSLNHELQQHSRGMTELLNRYVRLSGDGAPSESNQGEFVSRWQAHYLYLNKFKGLQAARPPVPARSRAPVSGIPVTLVRRPLQRLFGHALMRFAVKSAVLLGLLLLGSRLLGLDLRRTPEWLARAYHQLGTPPQSVAEKAGPRAPGEPRATGAAGGTAPTARDRVVRLGAPGAPAQYSVDGSGDFHPPAPTEWVGGVKELARRLTPQPLRNSLSNLFRPHGSEATLALLGILFFILAYFFFGRGR